MQLEYYLKAAQYGLSVALVEGEQPKRYEAFTTTNAWRRAERPDPVVNTSNIQPGNSFWLRMMDYPTTGPVKVRVKAHAVIPEGKGPPRMRVRIGLRPDTYVTGGTIGTDIDIWDTVEEPGIYEFTGRLEHYPMLLTGEQDFRTPMGESEQYYQALKMRKIDTALVRVPEASHGIANRPSHLIAKVDNILAWFKKYSDEAEQEEEEDK